MHEVRFFPVGDSPFFTQCVLACSRTQNLARVTPPQPSHPWFFCTPTPTISGLVNTSGEFLVKVVGRLQLHVSHRLRDNSTKVVTSTRLDTTAPTSRRQAIMLAQSGFAVPPHGDPESRRHTACLDTSAVSVSIRVQRFPRRVNHCPCIHPSAHGLCRHPHHLLLLSSK